MDNWQKVLVLTNATILEALECIDKGAIGAALVVDHHRRLKGIVTDGDVRRAILKEVSLQNSVDTIANTHFKFATVGDSREHIISLMQSFTIRHVPIVNDDHQIVGLETLDELLRPELHDNIVVLMAGGLGTRLRPLTDHCPKPLLRIETKPLLQISMERFIEAGFHQFIFTINYKKDMIQEYFGDGSAWGVSITYVEETTPLGTAGALGLIQQRPQKPFIVMNGDIITRTNFQHLLDFHNKQKSMATVGVREYKQTIPYGVVNIEQNYLLSLEEKPSHYFYVNGGIYVLEPDILNYIQHNTYLDMPDLVNILLKSNKKVNSFLIREYWADIGQIEDFNRASLDYKEYFLQ